MYVYLLLRWNQFPSIPQGVIDLFHCMGLSAEHFLDFLYNKAKASVERQYRLILELRSFLMDCRQHGSTGIRPFKSQLNQETSTSLYNSSRHRPFHSKMTSETAIHIPPSNVLLIPLSFYCFREFQNS